MKKIDLKSNHFLLIGVLIISFIFFSFATDSQAEESATTTEEISEDKQLEPIRAINDISTTTATSTKTSTTTEDQLKNQVNEPQFEENLNKTITPKFLLSNAKQKRILNLSANISNRFDATIYRHEKIISRLESRINKLEQTGRDVNEARSELATVKTNLASAKLIMSKIDFEVYEAITSDKPQGAWSLPKTSYQSTEKIVLENQSKLIKIVDDLKQTSTTIPEQTEEKNENENSETEQ